MRIALTIHALQGGGAERALARLAERWSTAGHEVHLITWSAVATDQISVPPAVQRHGLDLVRSSANLWQGLWANVRRIRALRRKLRELQPDFVLSFCDQMNISTLQAARGLRLPVWIAEHSDPSRQRLSRAWEWWRGRTYPRCTGCVALTSEIAGKASLLPTVKALYASPMYHRARSKSSISMSMKRPPLLAGRRYSTGGGSWSLELDLNTTGVPISPASMRFFAAA